MMKAERPTVPPKLPMETGLKGRCEGGGGGFDEVTHQCDEAFSQNSRCSCSH